MMNNTIKPTATAVKIAASIVNRCLLFSSMSAMLKVVVKSSKTTIKLMDRISPIGVIIKV